MAYQNDRERQGRFQGDSLIAGAYSAAGGGIDPKGLAASKAITKHSAAVAENIAPFMQQEVLKFQAKNQAFNEYMNIRGAEFESAAEQRLNRDDSLIKADRDALWKEMRKDKVKYLLGGKKKRAELTNKISKWKVQHDTANETEEKSAVTGLNPTTAGNNWNRFLTTPEGISYTDILNGKQQRVVNPDDPDNETLGYMINTPDGEVWMSVLDFDKKVQSYRFDENSSTIIGDLGSHFKSEGDAALKEMLNAPQASIDNAGYDFDYENTRMKISSDVINKGNIGSLAYDEHIPGRTFYDDLQERLVGTTYKQLGITEDQLRFFDDDKGPPHGVLSYEDGDGNTRKVNIDDGIDVMEARVITDELMKDENMLKGYLADYYTLHMKKQWPKDPSGKEADEIEKEEIKSGAKGGTTDESGVWTPSAINPDDYSHISIGGGKSLTDILNETDDEAERLKIINQYVVGRPVDHGNEPYGGVPGIQPTIDTEDETLEV